MRGIKARHTNNPSKCVTIKIIVSTVFFEFGKVICNQYRLHTSKYKHASGKLSGLILFNIN